MQLTLLNLGRSTDRLTLFYARNPHLANITRVSAIDGKTLDRAWLEKTGVIEANLRYSDGALGCAMSHLRLWRDAVKFDQVLTVIEDDAVLASNFEEEMKRTIESLPDDWDYIMWGYNFDSPLTFHLGAKLSLCTCMFNQDMLRANAATFSTETVSTLPMKLVRGFGTMAYSVSPRGAERLINFCLPLRPLPTAHPGLPGTIANRRIDNMLAHAWPAMSAHVAVPPLAISENDIDASTVQAHLPPKTRYNDDVFPSQAFDFVVDAMGQNTGFVVGLRATHEMDVQTKQLRQRGWGGFDIAIDPANVVKALTDRRVLPEFDLLYVGDGCDLYGLLSALLTKFQPRAIVMPSENSILASELATSQSAGATAAHYADLVEAHGYSIQIIPGAIERRLLLRGDPVGRDPHTIEAHQGELSRSGIRQINAEEVRLWH